MVHLKWLIHLAFAFSNHHSSSGNPFSSFQTLQASLPSGSPAGVFPDRPIFFLHLSLYLVICPPDQSVRTLGPRAPCSWISQYPDFSRVFWHEEPSLAAWFKLLPWGTLGSLWGHSSLSPCFEQRSGWHTESFDPRRSEDDELVGVGVASQHRESLAGTLPLDRDHDPISKHNTST